MHFVWPLPESPVNQIYSWFGSAPARRFEQEESLTMLAMVKEAE